ncbi:MAG: DUF3365 domain-containing protein [Flavobacteriaceae bacterium]|nr:DUF3365 domain-containing protein [Flavobacteriaceae bacterium]
MKKKIAFALLLVMVFFGCKQKNQTYSKKESKGDLAVIAEGEKLSTQQCALCHNSETAADQRVGPTIAEIKKAYRSSNTTETDFVKAVQTWVEKLDPSISKMPKAVEKYKLMPKGAYTNDDVAKIAKYWFRSDTEAKKQEAPKTPEEKGIAIALGTKKVLGKNLMGTIQKKGTDAALKFCNLKALHLTDSMATKFGATITRVSDKARNPKNKADSTALEIIAAYKSNLAEGKKLEAVVQDKGTEYQFYYPITTNSMCLQCHGVPSKNVKPVVLKNLKALYPADKALGYDVNQLRGIWNITFPK